MPSSLIFAALAVAWLVVLVPMFARRRQEVSRTTDSALAARVVRRGSDRHPVAAEVATTESATTEMVEEFGMPDTDRDELVVDDHEAEEARQQVHSEDARAGRRYRPGRGGFDPEAAAVAARAKYARRQRIVLFMLLAAITTGLLAGLLWPVVWWGHAAVDLLLAGYLTYLRRQVRIETDVRNRRLARITAQRDQDEHEEYEDSGAYQHRAETAEYDEDYPDDFNPDFDDYADDLDETLLDKELRTDLDPHPVAERSAPAPVPVQRQVFDPPSRGVRVEIDDEDPMFDELDERTWEPYRRAAGE